MSTHTAPVIGLVPTKKARPGLALALALLAVPGVTIAWDLPHGGFYTGVPLAVAGRIEIQDALILPVLCYVYVFVYASRGSRWHCVAPRQD